MKIEDKILKIHKLLTENHENDFRKDNDNFEVTDSELYRQLSNIWKVSKSVKKNTPIFDKVELKKNIFAEIDRFENNKLQNGKLLSLKRLSSIAAILLLLIFAISLFDSSVKVNNTISNNNNISLIKLNDNSHIILDKQAKLRKSNDFNKDQRLVFLEGNAYFNIEHDSKRPFIIAVDDFEITVLGTSFQIGHDKNNSVYVNVEQGVVKFNKIGQKSIVLRKGQCALYNDGIESFEDYIPEYSDIDIKKSFMHFENSDLNEVLKKLSDYFDIEFQIDCDQIKDFKGFTSPLNSDQRVDDYFATIEKLYNIEFIKINEKLFAVKCK